MNPEVESIINKYQLVPHPEGGYYREVYRSVQVHPSPFHGKERHVLTHIYFLLEKGQVSRMHKVLHDEIWNWYAGASLRLISGDLSQFSEVCIGPEQTDYFSVISAGFWQGAETSGEYTLCGCSVAPGFDFEDFFFMNEEEQKQARALGVESRFL